MRWPVLTSHTVTVWSALPDASRRPSGLNATPLPEPRIGGPTGRPVSASHNCSVSFRELAETMRCPSGLNATPDTSSPHAIGAPTGWPVRASHNRSV